MKLFFIFILISVSFIIKGQDTPSVDTSRYIETKPERRSMFGAIDLSFINFPMMKHDYNGFNIDIKGGPGKWLCGITFVYLQGSVTKDLSYYYATPILEHVELGLTGMCKLVNTKKSIISINFNMGLLVNTFGDDATRDEQTHEFLDKVTATTFYSAPGMDFSFRLFPSNSEGGMYFTSKIRYLIPAGYPKYGAPSDFTGYYLGAGFTFLGIQDR